MNTPYFNAPDKIFVLEKEALTWIGTPFADHAAVKRGGVDCVHLIAMIYVATGFMKNFIPPKYALGEGNHRRESKLLEWFKGRPDFSQHDGAEAPFAGDTLCFNMGLSEYHVGLMLQNGRFLHAFPKRLVMQSNLRESFYTKRITTIFRPLHLP